MFFSRIFERIFNKKEKKSFLVPVKFKCDNDEVWFFNYLFFVVPHVYQVIYVYQSAETEEEAKAKVEESFRYSLCQHKVSEPVAIK